MNTTLLDKDVKRYVDAVAVALVDLPDATRTEILEDLAAHLGEFDLANGTLDAQLGDPAVYAEELRASAGFAPPPSPIMGGSQVGAQVRRVADTVRAHRWSISTRAFLPSLEPAWWVLRAWLVVLVMAGATPSDIPIPAPNGNVLVGFALLALLIPMSVRLGQGAKRANHRHINRAMTALGIILLLVSFGGIRERHYDSYANSYSQSQPALIRALPVQLFDSSGQVPLGQQSIVTLDSRGYLVDDEQTVLLNGLVTPVGPCPNGRAYAACLRQDTVAVASTTTLAGASSTTLADASSTTLPTPSTTAAAAVPTTSAAPTTPSTTAAPAPPTTTSGG